MLFQKKNQFKDERIEKESNAFSARMIWFITAPLVVLLAVKLALDEPIWNYLLELLCLSSGWAYVLVRMLSAEVLFVKNADEELKDIRNGILAKGYLWMFNVMVFGEVIYMMYVISLFAGQGALSDIEILKTFATSREPLWMILYIVSWFGTAIAVTIASIKNGWMIWGSKKREVTGKKELAKRTAIASLFFGVFMSLPKLFAKGAFHPEVLWMVLVMAAAWGIPFYLIFAFLMKKAEKNADKLAEGEANEYEE